MSFFKNLFRKKTSTAPSIKKSKLHYILPEGWPAPTQPEATGKIRVDGVIYWSLLTDKTNNWVCDPDHDFYIRKLTSDGGAILVTMVFRRPGDDLKHPLFVLYKNPDEANPDAEAKYFPYFKKMFENEPGWGPAAYLGDMPEEEMPWEECPRFEPIGFVDLFQFDKENQSIGSEFFAVWQRHPDEVVWPASPSVLEISKSMQLADGYETILTNLLVNDWLKFESKELNEIPEKDITLLLKGPEGYPVVASFSRVSGIHFLTPHTAHPRLRYRIYEHWNAMLIQFHEMYKNKLEKYYYNESNTPISWWINANNNYKSIVYPEYFFGYAADETDPAALIPPLGFDPFSCTLNEVFPRITRLSGELPFGEIGENTTPHQHIFGNFYILYAADRGTHFQFITPPIYESLGKPHWDNLYKVGLENLASAIQKVDALGFAFFENESMGYVVAPEEWIATSVLLDSFWNKPEERLGGDLCICIPSLRQVAFCKWTDENSRNRLREICKGEAEKEILEALAISDLSTADAATVMHYELMLEDRLSLFKRPSSGSSWEKLENL